MGLSDTTDRQVGSWRAPVAPVAPVAPATTAAPVVHLKVMFRGKVHLT